MENQPVCVSNSAESNNTNKPKKSLAKNYIFNLIYQIVAIIAPLITTPYISRVLKSEGVGQYSFVYSICSYFIMFGALGFNYYAQREIAKYQDDAKKQSIIFWEIFLARLIPVVLSSLIYVGLIAGGLFNTYTTLAWISVMMVGSTALDVSYFFQGNENFKTLVIRNVIIKILGVAAIFIFVKKTNDVWIYTLCQAAILVLSNLTLWIGLPRALKKCSFKEMNIKKHFIPSLKLFIPTIAVSVYTMIDKTLIGVMVPGTTEIVDSAGNIITAKVADVENGYYDQSEKIVKLAMTIVTAIGAIMIPRNSYELSSGHRDTFVENINNALRVALFLALPIAAGLIGVSLNFSPWFFGEGFEKVPYLMMIFSSLVVFIGLSNVLSLQYLIPLQKDGKYTIAVCSGAVINIALNLALIRPLYSYGAAIASIISEFVVLLICIIFAWKDLRIKKLIKGTYKYFIASAIMFGAVFATQYFLKPSVWFTLLLIGEGIVVYFGLLLLMKDDLMFDFIKKTIGKIRRKKHE